MSVLAERTPKRPAGRRDRPASGPRDGKDTSNPWGRGLPTTNRQRSGESGRSLRDPAAKPRGGQRPVWGRADQERQPGADARAAAALAIHRVRDRGQSLTRVLNQSTLPRPPADRALTQELIYGTLRVLPRLEALVGSLLREWLSGPAQSGLRLRWFNRLMAGVLVLTAGWMAAL